MIQWRSCCAKWQSVGQERATTCNTSSRRTASSASHYHSTPPPPAPEKEERNTTHIHSSKLLLLSRIAFTNVPMISFIASGAFPSRNPAPILPDAKAHAPTVGGLNRLNLSSVSQTELPRCSCFTDLSDLRWDLHQLESKTEALGTKRRAPSDRWSQTTNDAALGF